MHFRSIRLGTLSACLALAVGYSGCSSDDGGGGQAGGGNSTSTGGSTSGGSGGSNAGGTGAGGISFGGSGGGGNSDGGGGTSSDACASTVVQSDLVPANLLFVIDRSGSMNCNLPADGQPSSQCENFPAPIDTNKPTKWALTKTALEQAIDDLALAGNTSAGMVVFPRPSSDCNVVQTPDVSIANLDTAQVTALKGFLGGVAPKGKTPLAGATILSYAHLYELLKAGSLTGNLFVVLLTDGFETCATSELPKLIGQDVPTAYGQLKIRTFVIGVPGSENGRALLSQIAYAGGTPKSTTCTHNPTPNDQGDCHFDMTLSSNFSQDLKNALAQISGTVLSCEIDVPKAPPVKKVNPNDVKVKVSGSVVPQDSSTTCDQANGWQFSSDKAKIFLCGTACDDAKKPNSKIELDLGCLQDVR